MGAFFFYFCHMISNVYLFLGIGGPEFLVIAFVFLLVFGPGKIPEIARGIGKGMKAIRHATEDIKREINESADKSENLKDLKEDLKDAQETFEEIRGTIKRNTKI